ncbi:MAG: CoA transferase [Deltaproteobacteria bacterium]|nr:CoA transferase [Deltaproteobacteria bacterium]MBW2312277.1 CoA transferase [Deltaproteobacteria bacterium]
MTGVKDNLPLSGIRALELGHAVMGPTCGLILADMGAEVIKIERAPKGDDNRRLLGFGLGLFPFFNRNKKSLVLDLKSERGKEILKRLIASADVLFENFGPGVVDRLGFSYEACADINPQLIYCNLKGFMPGPYERRPSLDNLVQMMAGLAYMTGPRGRPLRAGSSIIDILGGTFGALGIITALYERKATGQGKRVVATLYEATAFLVRQHMAVSSLSGEPSIPMPDGANPWSVYDLFDTQDGEMVFIGLTSDQHWQRFCETFDLDSLLADERLATNNTRVGYRDLFIPQLKKVIGQLPKAKVVELCDKAAIPFAPIVRQDEPFEDPQLNEGGSLVETTLPSGVKAKLPKLPLRLGEYDFGLRSDPPALGMGSLEVLKSIGLSNQ